MPDTDSPLQPPARLRGLASWQASKVSTLGARLTARRMPLGARADFAVLAALEEYGPLSQAEIGRRLGLDRNDVNGILNRLQTGHLVDRQPDPADRRRNVVTLTDAGRGHLEELQEHADAVQDELLAGLDAPERRQLHALMAKLLDSHQPPARLTATLGGMSFEVAADAYGRFMGRYAEPLATEFVALTGLRGRALDVGCGTGVLTAELVERLGAEAVAAVDPSEAFVAAARSRFPAVDIRRAGAEDLPFADGVFDYVFAQLVVHFMSDPVAGLREMARVARPGGVVAACVWDHAGGRGPVSVFWRAVLELDPSAHDESGLAGAREGHLAELFAAAGLREIEPAVLTVRTTFAGFAEWWETYTLGVGPAGDYVRRLDASRSTALQEKCALLLPPEGPIEVTASAWAAVGRS